MVNPYSKEWSLGIIYVQISYNIIEITSLYPLPTSSWNFPHYVLNIHSQLLVHRSKLLWLTLLRICNRHVPRTRITCSVVCHATLDNPSYEIKKRKDSSESPPKRDILCWNTRQSETRWAVVDSHDDKNDATHNVKICEPATFGRSVIDKTIVVIIAQQCLTHQEWCDE